MISSSTELRIAPARSAGFTLIEVMIAVVILAILTAVALPSYQDHLRKGRRAAAQGFMMQVANKQQQHLIDTRGYALGASAVTDPSPAGLSLTVPTDVSGYYTLTVNPAVATTPPTFNIVATPVAGGPQVKDGVLELSNLGAKVRTDINGVVTGW